MKLWLKALLYGAVLTALDYAVITAFPPIGDHAPFSLQTKYLFTAMVMLGMNAHSPSTFYVVLAIAMLFLFFVISSAALIALSRARVRRSA